MPRSVAALALAATLSACGGGSTDLATEESSPDTSVVQGATITATDTPETTDASDTTVALEPETSADIVIDSDDSVSNATCVFKAVD